MQAIKITSKSRGIVARVLKNPTPILFNLPQLDESVIENAAELNTCSPLPRRRSFHSAAGVIGGNCSKSELCCRNDITRIPSFMMAATPFRLFSAEATAVESDPADAETVKGVYDKMLDCVTGKRTAPPNAWLWSLIAGCSTQEDIKLLFDILQKLRILRLSNLRISDNFNSALCREVTKACVRAGAIDYGKKALWKNNLLGLTPDIGSAHYLLLHAKQHNDVNLMVEVMKLVKKNELPLQPGTADIIFSICCNTNRWDLASKYGKRFLKSEMKLRQTSFELWIDFAARKGDVESLWKIEKCRSEAMKKHSLLTGISCAKGFLLDHKPEDAAAIVQAISQTLPDAKRPVLVTELQKLASEWPSEVLKNQKEDNRQAMAETLQNDISALINALPSLGVKATISVDDLSSKVATLS